MANLSHNEWNFMNQISLEIHANQDLEDMRGNFFASLKRLVAFDYASFYLYKNGHSIDPIGYNLTKTELQGYIERWEQFDPFRPLRKMLSSYSHSAVRVDEYAFTENVEETEYYQGVWKPKNIRFSVFAGLGYKDTSLGSLSLFRKSGREHFSDRDIEIVNLLKDHLNIRLWQENLKENPFKTGYLPYIKLRQQYGITERELEIMDLLRKGYADEKLCEEISISKNTLKKHISNIFNKLGISSRVELLKFFAES